MEYRELGRTGVKVSPLCLGTDNFTDPTPEPECVEMLAQRGAQSVSEES